MRITLKQLSVFVAIARHGTMTRAADVLFMTKGAVSQALAELENQLGVCVFDRQRARLHLNHEGEKLLPLADELLARSQGVAALFGKQGADTRLAIGATRTIGSYLLPDMFAAFDRENGWLPGAAIDNSQVIEGMLCRFEIDMALVEAPLTDPMIVCEPWLEDEMVVLAAKTHRLAGKKQVSFAELADERWLLREPGSGSRAFFDNHLAPCLDNPSVFLSLNAPDTILACVGNDLGVTFVSRRVLAQPFYAGQFAVLETERRFLRPFTLCYHRDKYVSPTLEKWMAFCRGWEGVPGGRISG